MKQFLYGMVIFVVNICRENSFEMAIMLVFEPQKKFGVVYSLVAVCV